MERAGGTDVFAALKSKRIARDRALLPEQVCAANPEIIFASWCGKPLERAEISVRAGWSGVAAVQAGRIYEIPGEDILQPGFRLVHGYERMKKIIGQS
jgi:iron complex transport system substrate-binding protein